MLTVGAPAPTANTHRRWTTAQRSGPSPRRVRRPTRSRDGALVRRAGPGAARVAAGHAAARAAAGVGAGAFAGVTTASVGAGWLAGVRVTARGIRELIFAEGSDAAPPQDECRRRRRPGNRDSVGLLPLHPFFLLRKSSLDPRRPKSDVGRRGAPEFRTNSRPEEHDITDRLGCRRRLPTSGEPERICSRWRVGRVWTAEGETPECPRDRGVVRPSISVDNQLGPGRSVR